MYIAFQFFVLKANSHFTILNCCNQNCARIMGQTIPARWIPCLRNNQVRRTVEQEQHSEHHNIISNTVDPYRRLSRCR